MSDQKYALVIRVDSVDLGLGDAEVLLFDSEKAAETFAVNILVLTGLYARSLEDGLLYSDNGKSFASKAEVLSDFDIVHLDHCERFYVATVKEGVEPL